MNIGSDLVKYMKGEQICLVMCLAQFHNKRDSIVSAIHNSFMGCSKKLIILKKSLSS